MLILKAKYRSHDIVTREFEEKDGSKTEKEQLIVQLETEEPDQYNEGRMKLQIMELKCPPEQAVLLPKPFEDVEIMVRPWAFKSESGKVSQGLTGLQIMPGNSGLKEKPKAA